MQTQSNYDSLERKNQFISGAITFSIYLTLFLLAFFWKGVRTDRIAPLGVGDGVGGGYELVGELDFGDGREGSKNINNFDKAVENPTPKTDPAPNLNPTPAPPTPQTPTQTTKSPTLTGNDEKSPVTLPPVKTPTTSPKTTTPPKTQPKVETEDLYQPNTGGGSNHGKGKNNEVGNAGSPDIKTLDPDGLYAFGTGGGGGGGLNGRKPVNLEYPVYNVQEEGLMTYEFMITPDGSTENIKLIGTTNKIGLKNAGINAIKRWRFTTVESNQNQMVRVTIKFKLRG